MGCAKLDARRSLLILTFLLGCMLASGCASNLSSSVTQYEDGVRKQLAALEIVEDLVAEAYAFSFKRDVILANENFGGCYKYQGGFKLTRCKPTNSAAPIGSVLYYSARTGSVLYKDLSERKLEPTSKLDQESPYAALKLWTGPVDLRVRALLRQYAANMSAIYGAETAAQLNDALRTANYSPRLARRPLRAVK